MAKSYSEARKQHGESELLDEITSTKPQTDHTRYHSEQELKEGGLQHIRAAIQDPHLTTGSERRINFGRFCRIAQDQIDANITAQPRNRMKRTLRQANRSLTQFVRQWNAASQIVKPAVL